MNFEKRKQRLALSWDPTELPGREREILNIENFVTPFLDQNSKQKTSSQTVYIAGVPGTGKTATVRKIVSQKQKEPGSNFTFIEVNGGKLTNPREAYVSAVRSLTKKKESAPKALKSLAAYLKKQTKCTIILLDELDKLVNKNQDVIYTFFNWTTVYPKLMIIGIANTIDLPNTLDNKVASRIGQNKIHFAPYKRPELQKIILSRSTVDGSSIFEPESVDFCCAKVAGVSGDARRALAISERAATIAQDQNKELKDEIFVNSKHVDLAIKDLLENRLLQTYVNDCSWWEKFFLLSVAIDTERTNVSELSFEAIVTTMLFRFNFLGLEKLEKSFPTSIQLICIAANLVSCRLLIADSFESGRFQRISLNVPVDEIKHALMQTEVAREFNDIALLQT